MTSRTLDQIAGGSVFLKCENFQRAGAFKFRGAYNTLSQLSESARKKGIISFSSGNHAQGVALAARELGIPATCVMPEDAPAVKLAATRGYGAKVVLYNRQNENREEVARKWVEEHGLTLIPPFDHPHIIAGQGTVTLEFLDQAKELEAILIPVGGGGLISGCAVAAHAISPTIRIIGVEPESANDTQLSLQAGKRIFLHHPETIADGLRSPMPGELTFPLMQEHVEDIITVRDEDIMEAMLFAFTRLKLVIEPSAAVSLAAVLTGKFRANGKRVGLILSGGNVDLHLLAKLAQIHA
jgi:threonine dehydratase